MTTDIGALLDMVERGCERLMRTGGGALSIARCRRVTPDQLARFITLHKEGKSLVRIGRLCGVAQSTVGYTLRAHGFDTGRSYIERRQIADARRRKAVQLSKRGFSRREVAAALGISYTRSAEILRAAA